MVILNWLCVIILICILKNPHSTWKLWNENESKCFKLCSMITSLGQFEAQFKNNIKIKIIGLGAVGTGAIKMRSTSQNRDFIFSDHWSFGGLYSLKIVLFVQVIWRNTSEERTLFFLSTLVHWVFLFPYNMLMIVLHMPPAFP